MFIKLTLFEFYYLLFITYGRFLAIQLVRSAIDTLEVSQFTNCNKLLQQSVD